MHDAPPLRAVAKMDRRSLRLLARLALSSHPEKATSGI